MKTKTKRKTKRFKHVDWNLCYVLWAKHNLRTAYQEGRYWLAKN